MNRKKILHIITKGSPFGGAQKYVCDLITHLPQNEFESVLVVGAGEELPKKIHEYGTTQNTRIIQIQEMGRDLNVARDVTSFFKITKIIFDEKPDVIHVSSSKAAGLGALATFIIRLFYIITRNKTHIPKIIFTAHGWAFNEVRPAIQIYIIRFISWITILLSDYTIVIAKNEEAQALNMPFTRSKIRLIYNGIEPIPFIEKDTAQQYVVSKTKLPLDPHATWIGTIAELHKNKNLEQAIIAFSHITENALFIIIGEGEERMTLEQKIKELGLEKKVFLVGKIPHASTYLKAFDIFTLPSTKEGLPYTLLEAGLASLPCLSTYVGGIPEIIYNNISGTLVEPTSKKLHSGFEFLIQHPEKAKKFGIALHTKVEKDFSLEKMVEETVRVYNN